MLDRRRRMFAVEVDGLPVAIVGTYQEAQALATQIMCGDGLFSVVRIVALHPAVST
jgi:hypothetical protein